MRSPTWIAGFLIAGVAVFAFVNLGLWQLRRLDERRVINAEIVAAQEQDPIDLAIFLAQSGDPNDLVWRRISAEGVYATDLEVILSGRSHKARPGHNVLTPLILNGGAALIVNRGWIPFELDEPPVAEATPPAGRVTVVGTLRPDEGAGLLAGATGDDPVRRIASIDLVRIGADQEVGSTFDVYLQLAEQDPGQGSLPEAIPLSEVSEGSHLSYAVQWFVFAAVVLIGFPALVWRTSQSRSAG